MNLNQGHPRHASFGLLVFNLNCRSCIFELNFLMFSFKSLSNQNGLKRKLNTVSIKSACIGFQPISSKVSLFKLWACQQLFCFFSRATFLQNSGAHTHLEWDTGCYRWSPDSPHMVPRWSPQSLGGHTWVNRVPLSIGHWGHWWGWLRVILLSMMYDWSSTWVVFTFSYCGIWSMVQQSEIPAEYNEP